MTSSIDAAILPITLTVNGRTGLTLWAPPWEDDEGEEWQGFLGDGAKIVLFPNTRELGEFIASGEENDLSDHPAWGRVMKLTPDDLRPSGDDAYDLDQVYEWASGEPDPVHVSALGNVVDMVEKIAECCDDGALRRLVGSTPEYAELVSDEVSYQGKEGRKRWNELGDVIADTWERAISRVESWLTWRGDFSETDLDTETVWDRVGAEPIELVLPDATYLTVRAEIDDEAVFLGEDGEIAVFTEPADLARYCRKAKDHELVKLERWAELAEADDDAFEPLLDSSYDLTAPSTKSAELVRELAAFCDLDADAEDLGDPIDPEQWTALVAEIETCLQPKD
ncbi:MAG TPA: hypothetical protein VGL39_28575 [Jatrophihabitantaceae bacterium]